MLCRENIANNRYYARFKGKSNTIRYIWLLLALPVYSGFACQQLAASGLIISTKIHAKVRSDGLISYISHTYTHSQMQRLTKTVYDAHTEYTCMIITHTIHKQCLFFLIPAYVFLSLPYLLLHCLVYLYIYIYNIYYYIHVIHLIHSIQVYN